MPRSLRVRQDYLLQVKLAVTRNGFPSQRALAEELGFARSTVVNFLTGKPVDRAVFEEICQRLCLSSQEIGTFNGQVTTVEPLHQTIPGHQDLGEAPDVSLFYGREVELATLQRWLLQDKCRIVALLGVGGIGKTALSTKLVHRLHDAFETVVWRSLRNAPPLADILADILRTLMGASLTLPSVELSDLTTHLIGYLQQHRCLLILDNYESILCEGSQAGEYRVGYELYGQFLRNLGEVDHQSSLLLTSREKPRELVHLEGSELPGRSLLLSGISQQAGHQLLQVKGTSGDTAALRSLVEWYNGNPLALKVIATTIQDLFDGNVTTFLSQETHLFGDIWNLLSEQFARLSPLEVQIMYCLAVEREWISLTELRAHIYPPVTARQLLEAIESLHRRSLIEKQQTRFTQQPVIMEYVTNRLIEQVLQEIWTQTPALLHQVSLIKAQAQDYIRNAQVRVILTPILTGLQEYLRTDSYIRHHLDRLLTHAHQQIELRLGYLPGNLINLYRYFNLDITAYDFSGLVLRQAYLQDMELHDLDFSQVEFVDCRFTQTFGGVLHVAFRPDGQALAASSTNCEIQLWQLADQKRLLTLQGHTNWIRCIAFSPDGEWLASASDDQTLRVWHLAQGICQQVLTGHTGSVYGVAFSPDGRLIASTGSDNTVRLWNLLQGNCVQVLEGHQAGTLSVSFSPCGQLLATSSFDQTIRIWDVSEGTCLRTISYHTNWVTGLRFSPDGQWLATPSCDRTICLWQVTDWQCVKVLEGHTGWIWGVDWHPDSQQLISYGTDCTGRVWQVSSGQCLHTLTGHTTQIWRATFSPDGQMIATGAEDQTIALWDATTGRRLSTMTGYSNWVRSVVFSPDGTVFATGHKDRSLRIWCSTDHSCKQTIKAHATGIAAVAFHPEGKLLATGGADAVVKVWDWQQSQCLLVLQGHQDEVWGLAFNPTGELLASSSFDQTIQIWRLADKTCLATFRGHCDRIPTIAFHPENSLLASGSDDCTIKLWDTFESSCRLTLTGHTARVSKVAFSTDGHHLLSASLDQTLKLWDVQTGECLQTLTGHENWVMSAAFLPDNCTIVSASCDLSLKFWNRFTGECLQTLQGHTNWVWDLAINPDGQQLVSASEDESVRIWQLQTNKCLAVLKPDGPYRGMRIAGVTGLTLAQASMLRELGAV